MDWDILKKEQEYHKENELIESKTKALLQKVDDAMKMQETRLKESITKAESCYRKPVLTKSTKEEKEKILSSFSEISLEDPAVPNVTAVNDMGQKMHHFYRAKIKSLKEEYDELQTESKNKNSEIKQLQKELNQNVEDKEKWLLQYNLGKNQIGKLEFQISVLTSKIQTKDSENAAMKKEIDNLKREIKVMTQSTNTNEIRINKALEENEKNKLLLKKLKKDEKEMKENHKKQVSELTNTIQQIEKHKSELLQGFKKQMQLIENLKQQKEHLKTFNIAEWAEAELMKILDWKGEP